jgi:hypothetical protein
VSKHLLASLAALCFVALVPTAAVAGGGETIAAAPTLSFGTLEAGGGQQLVFWRVSLFAGDALTVDLEVAEHSSQTYFDLFDPAVTDFTISKSHYVASSGVLGNGKQQFTLTSPFTGLGTLVVCSGLDETCHPGGVPVKPLTFTAVVSHATHIAVSAPVLAKRRSIVTVRVTVQSPAGTPHGACLIQGVSETLAGGRCSRRIRLGRQARQRIAVSFVPEDGWNAATGSRVIRTVR